MKSLLNLYKLTHVYSEHKTWSQGSSIRRGFSIVEQTMVIKDKKGSGAGEYCTCISFSLCRDTVHVMQSYMSYTMYMSHSF